MLRVASTKGSAGPLEGRIVSMRRGRSLTVGVFFRPLEFRTYSSLEGTMWVSKGCLDNRSIFYCLRIFKCGSSRRRRPSICSIPVVKPRGCAVNFGFDMSKDKLNIWWAMLQTNLDYQCCSWSTETLKVVRLRARVSSRNCDGIKSEIYCIIDVRGHGHDYKHADWLIFFIHVHE